MPKTISAMEARQNFGQILNEVSLLGEMIIIERSGKPIARLVPMNYSDKQSLDFRDIGKLPSEIWNNMNTAAYLSNERDLD